MMDKSIAPSLLRLCLLNLVPKVIWLAFLGVYEGHEAERWKRREALDEIARMIGGDLSGAREYCLAIQKHCHPAPSFASIADSLWASSPGKATIQQVAELAGQIHLGLMVAVEIEEAEILPVLLENEGSEKGGTGSSPTLSIDEAILPATSVFVETISKHGTGDFLRRKHRGQGHRLHG